MEELDGLVLIGGRDVPPALYGQKPHETVKLIPPRRVSLDRALIARWKASKKPIMGICLGMQFVNVVMGGSLIQDIPSEVGAKVVVGRQTVSMQNGKLVLGTSADPWSGPSEKAKKAARPGTGASTSPVRNVRSPSLASESEHRHAR